MQILVLGMHRSGTSLTTRLINLMGAYIGPAKLLLPATPDNPKGFWERQDVLRANIEILKSQSCNWYKVNKWDGKTIEPPDLAFQLMRQAIDELSTRNPWVMKDPRLCLTLPAWQPHLSKPVAVIVSRHPLEIARSLEMRNQIPMDYGLALWEQYAVCLIRNAHKFKRIFNDYDAMLHTPLDETQRLCDQLSEHIPALCLPSRSSIEEFITPSLKKASRDDSLELSPFQQNLYAMLRGETEWDSAVQLSPESLNTLRQKVSDIYEQQATAGQRLS